MKTVNFYCRFRLLLQFAQSWLQMKEMNKDSSEFGVRMENAMVTFETKISKYIKIVSHDAKRATTCDLRLLKCVCEPHLLRQVHCQSV